MHLKQTRATEHDVHLRSLMGMRSLINAGRDCFVIGSDKVASSAVRVPEVALLTAISASLYVTLLFANTSVGRMSFLPYGLYV